jgi:glutathione synthase
MRVAVIVTSARVVDASWTTAHLIDAMTRLGHVVRLFEPTDFEVTSAGRLVARAWCIDQPEADVEALSALIKQQGAPRRYVELSNIDLLLVRVNPMPSYLLQLLLMAADQGVICVNHPSGLARTRGKAWLASLADVPRPPTVLTASPASALTFARQLGGPVVVKPTQGSGGRGVRLVAEGDDTALEKAVIAARTYGGQAIVQGYMPEAEAGEKRLFWVNGRLVGGYLRTRGEGEFRHNLKQGGQPAPCAVEPADEALCAAISPHLLANGIAVAGLDVIGGKLVEVNTLNPGGVHWADHFSDAPPGTLATVVVRALEDIVARGEGAVRPSAGAQQPQSRSDDAS